MALYHSPFFTLFKTIKMKKIQENNSGKIRLVPDRLCNLYTEMKFAKPIFDEYDRNTFLTNIDSDIAIDIYESMPYPECDNDDMSDWDEWYEKYQRRHLKKYGKYLYI